MTYNPIHQIASYQARCTECGYIQTEYGDFSGFDNPDRAIEDVAENGWFERSRITKVLPPDDQHPHGRQIVETVALLCLDCQKCEVCDVSPAYEVDGHLVCDDHEDHDFPKEA